MSWYVLCVDTIGSCFEYVPSRTIFNRRTSTTQHIYIKYAKYSDNHTKRGNQLTSVHSFLRIITSC